MIDSGNVVAYNVIVAQTKRIFTLYIGIIMRSSNASLLNNVGLMYNNGLWELCVIYEIIFM